MTRSGFGTPESCTAFRGRSRCKPALPTIIEKLFRYIEFVFERLTQPVFIVAIVVILAVEILRPARPRQSVISRGFCQDFMWFVMWIAIWGLTMNHYLRGLEWFFSNHLSFLRLDIGERWPMSALIIVAFVVGDFLAWLDHYIRHKVPIFWWFHKIHHSQTEMNLFADARVHVVERFISQSIIFAPFFALGGDFSRTIFLFAVLQPWYAHFYHANIKTNLGILKHVFVTPQYHRIHHSVEERHRDRNFGDVLTIWDRLFGTMYPSYDEYPDTGVTDKKFPMEKNRNWAHLTVNFCRQLIYPFRRLD